MAKFKVIKDVPKEDFAEAYHPELAAAVKACGDTTNEESDQALKDLIVRMIKEDAPVIVPARYPISLKQIRQGSGINILNFTTDSGEVTGSFFSSVDQYRLSLGARDGAYPVAIPIGSFFSSIVRETDFGGCVVDASEDGIGLFLSRQWIDSALKESDESDD